MVTSLTYNMVILSIYKNVVKISLSAYILIKLVSPACDHFYVNGKLQRKQTAGLELSNSELKHL